MPNNYPFRTSLSQFLAQVEPTGGTPLSGAAHAIRLLGEPTTEPIYAAPNAKDDLNFGGIGNLPPERPAGKGRRIRGRGPWPAAGRRG